jgi:hypothetical protein
VKAPAGFLTGFAQGFQELLPVGDVTQEHLDAAAWTILFPKRDRVSHLVLNGWR